MSRDWSLRLAKPQDAAAMPGIERDAAAARARREEACVSARVARSSQARMTTAELTTSTDPAIGRMTP